MSTAPSLDFVGATETTIEVEFKPLSGISDYQLQWKEYPAKWGSDSGRKAVVVQKNKCKLLAEDLTPGTTYCVRLTCQEKDPGPELIIDTEQVGCTPKTGGRCNIL